MIKILNILMFDKIVFVLMQFLVFVVGIKIYVFSMLFINVYVVSYVYILI